MEDFVFGTLANDQLRIAHVRNLWQGVTHNQERLPLAPKPGEPVTLELMIGPRQNYDRAWVYWSSDGSDPIGQAGQVEHGFVTQMEQVDTTWNVVEWGYRTRFQAVLPAQPEGTLVRYYLAAGDANGQEIIADKGKRFAFYVTNTPLPEWTHSAVIYQIFVDRFYPGDNLGWNSSESLGGFFGGNLRGITQKLDYIQDLGANVLWLTPIFPSPTHHGYDATDLLSIEPRFGTKADLKELLNAAHQKGMRVLLDFVPNHWSSLHPTFQAAISDRNSPYVDWYIFNAWPDAYETFFGVKELPQLNLRNPETRQHVLKAVAYWLEFGVDGFRVDYAVGPTPDIWAAFRQTALQTKVDNWTFGEVVEPSDSQLKFYGGLNGCLDFMLLEALRNTFVFRKWSSAEFTNFLDRHESYFPEDFSRPSFLDNHDMNRYLWAANGSKESLKLAALCQFTLIGPPVIYYGTEVGLSQERDVRQNGRGIPEESRLPMLWGAEQDNELFRFYQDLISLRLKEPALQRGKRKKLFTGDDVIGYERFDQSHSLAILLNPKQKTIKIAMERKWQEIVFRTNAGCKLSRQNDMVSIELPPMSGVVIR